MAMTFVWKGTTPKGDAINGEYQAGNKQEVAAYLRKKKIQVKSIYPKSTSREIRIGGPKKVKVKDMSIFTRQFSTMINAGLPIVQCLDILGKQTENDTLRKAINEVMLDVEGGNTLAESLAKHQKIFNNLYTNMVDAGEQGGILDIILGRLAVYLEKADALQRKVKSAMTYPSIVAIVAGGATVFMLMFVIPVFAKMFSDFGGELPLPTKVVMGLSDFLRSQWYLLAGGVAACVFGYKMARRNPAISTRSTDAPEGAGDRQRAAQGLGGPLHPHVGDAGRFGCADPAGSRHHLEDGGEPGDRARDLVDPRLDQPGRHHCRAPAQEPGSSRPWSCR